MNYFSVDAKVRLTARAPAPTTIELDAHFFGDLDTPVTETLGVAPPLMPLLNFTKEWSSMNRLKHNSQRLSAAGCILRMALPAFLIIAALHTTALADTITDWNERAFATMTAARVSGSVAPARTLAMMHTAMFDVVNAATQSNASSASREAAAHAAARRVLVDLYPMQQTGLDAAFDAALVKLPDGAPKSDGIAAGERAAAAILADRKADGFNAPDTYRPATSPGVYITTALPLMSHVAGIKPFALQSVSQFRPGPPPKLDSALWARDYNETKELGAVNSTKRTAWQAETARFWEIPGPPAWNEAARSLIASKPVPLAESARLFMSLNVASFDAYLAIFDAKYQYGFWRPVTAIRNGDRDGNDATERDAAWLPAITTPVHPEYPCAHCVVDGAAGVVMKSVFGSGAVPEFTLTYAVMPGVTRKYSTIQQLEDEVSMARIWGGVHYRNSTEVGHEMGKLVGEFVLKNYMRRDR